jgi:hypothetical protein
MLQIEFMNGWIKLYPRYVVKTMNLRDVRRLAALIVQDLESYDRNIELLKETLSDLENNSEIDNRRVERFVRALSKKGIDL